MTMDAAVGTASIAGAFAIFALVVLGAFEIRLDSKLCRKAIVEANTLVKEAADLEARVP